MTRCPECGRNTVDSGVGLMGGGYGTYYFCTRKKCSFFFKEQECEVCESTKDPEGNCPECGTPEQIKQKLAVLYPPTCRACGRITASRLADGKCGNLCSDGLACGGEGS